MILNRILDSILYIILALLIVLSPVFLGSVEPFSRKVLRLEILIIFIIWLIIQSKSKEASVFSKPGKSFTLLLFFILLCILQIVPLPVPLINLLSPETGKIWQSATAIIKEFSTDYSSYFNTLSLVPHYTKNMIIGIICYVLLGYVTARKFTSSRVITFIVFSFAAVLLMESVIGGYQFLTGNNTFSEIKSRIATGTFVNKNHFAGFLELSIPLTASYLFYQLHSFDKKQLLTSKLFKSFQTAALTFITGLSLVVFVFSFSRMGYISLFGAISITLILYVKITGKFNRKMLIPLAFILIFILFGVSKSFNTFSESISRTDKDIGGRITIYKDTLKAVGDFPLTGSGLGTFRAVYPGYKTLEEANTVNYAHNDYLQMALETGITGFALLMSALFLFLKNAFRTLCNCYEQNDYFNFYIKLGALCSIFSILIHSLCDFNLHIPSNAVYFAILAGIISRSETKTKAQKPKKRRKRAIPLAGSGL